MDIRDFKGCGITMFCRKCGAKIVEGALFCAHCGGEISNDLQIQKTQKQPYNNGGVKQYFNRVDGIQIVPSVKDKEPIRNEKNSADCHKSEPGRFVKNEGILLWKNLIILISIIAIFIVGVFLFRYIKTNNDWAESIIEEESMGKSQESSDNSEGYPIGIEEHETNQVNNIGKETDRDIGDEEFSSKTEGVSLKESISAPKPLNQSFSNDEYYDVQKSNMILGMPWGARYDDVLYMWENDLGVQVDWNEHRGDKRDESHDLEMICANVVHLPELFPDESYVTMEADFKGDKLYRIQVKDVATSDYAYMSEIMECVQEKVSDMCGEPTCVEQTESVLSESGYEASCYYWYLDGDENSGQHASPYITLVHDTDSNHIVLTAECGTDIWQHLSKEATTYK